MEIPDDIIKGCQQKDSGCQEKLYNMAAPPMYGLCLQYAGNEQDASDIMQEAFIKVFEKVGQYRGKGSFMGWMRRIIINTALERYRKSLRQSPVEDITELKTDEAVQDEILDELMADEILKAIQQLTPQYRVTFNLYAIEGYSHKEISEMTGISEGTSKSNVSRARKILQGKIGKLYSERMRIKK